MLIKNGKTYGIVWNVDGVKHWWIALKTTMAKTLAIWLCLETSLAENVGKQASIHFYQYALCDAYT